MATEGGGKEMNEIKTQFTTREGLYKLLPHSEYSRPNRVPFNSQGSNPVRVSFVNLNDQSGNGDRLCFNVGRELYFYIYKGVRKENEAQLNLKSCHSEKGLIKLLIARMPYPPSISRSAPAFCHLLSHRILIAFL
ncbi:WD repeat-containing protein 20 isoform X11 [Canis lupus baileyi]|uniref:WD repeat-containing protein 20 isoform X11 n=1 Tax=Canis lupus familiaris TaxID=9615 RepID=UPI000DC6BB70|nr:WD repeat-containing protein 20 isoform X11 [Canis lupus familiaris]XP_038530614.1 WD repeat-containing protein 20 isoform X11 [Canis lupus familiaris]XP_048969455.1 WD repeat-containing protein 20 isoform X11 [Canis lupus dingo]